MQLSDLEDLIQELKEQEDSANIRLDMIDISNYSYSEYLKIVYWNKYGFKTKIEKKVDIIE